LTPGELRELGISAVAVDILELALGPGLERLAALGGCEGFLGWDGPVLAIARVTEQPVAAAGWRAGGLPQLLSGDGGRLRLKSAVDGRVIAVHVDELAAACDVIGAVPSAQLSTRGPVFAYWARPMPQAPAGELVVSPLAATLAGEGVFWEGGDWASLDERAGAGALVDGCTCRTCSTASRDYLNHLRHEHEMTAQHLLGWHNMHWLRHLVEERDPGPAWELRERIATA
jgi:hypothetical protein